MLKSVDRLIRLIFGALLAVVLISTTANLSFQNYQDNSQVPYLPFLGNPDMLDMVFVFITFTILFNTFVPISLYVTLESVKVFQAKLINRDPQMYFANATCGHKHEHLIYTMILDNSIIFFRIRARLHAMK